MKTKELTWDNPEHRLEIIRKYLPDSKKEAQAVTSLADVLDAFDTWIPWMIDHIAKLEREVKLWNDALAEVEILRAKLRAWTGDG